MNRLTDLSAAQARHDHSTDLMAELNDVSERKEAALRQHIEADPERVADAVCDYWTGIPLTCDGQEVLTEWTLALAGSEAALNAVCRGDAIPDNDLQAFRALLAAVESAKRRKVQAVQDAVDEEMLK